MKLIVIGPSLAGKTTLVKYFRSESNVPVAEMDDELVERNNGTYPTDVNYKHNVLAPGIIKDIVKEKEIIFFSGTDYFKIEDLKAARSAGFKIVLLSLGLEEFNNRNEKRIRDEGYDDMSQWFAGMLRYQNEVMDNHLADQVFDATLPVEILSQNLLAIQ